MEKKKAAASKRPLPMESENTLRASMKARIRELGELPLFMSGTFVHTERKCGSPTCECANGGRKHPCFLLTRKVAGKTKSVYVPVDLAEEAGGWAETYRRMKGILKEVDRLGEEIIRHHVASRRALAAKGGR